MRYGVSDARRVFCKKHEQFYPSVEICPYCVVKPWVPPKLDYPEDCLKAFTMAGWVNYCPCEACNP